LFGFNAKEDCFCSDLGDFKAMYPQRAQRKPLVAFLKPLEGFLAQKMRTEEIRQFREKLDTEIAEELSHK
jgi:hypothetical protein